MRLLPIILLAAASRQMFGTTTMPNSEAQFGDIHLGAFSKKIFSGLWSSDQNIQANFVNSRGGMMLLAFDFNSTTPKVLPFKIRIYEGHFYEDKLLAASLDVDLKEEHQKALDGNSNSDVKLGDKFQLVNTLEACVFESGFGLKTIDGQDLDITTDEIHNIVVLGSISSKTCNISLYFKVTPLQIALAEALVFVFFQIACVSLGSWPFVKAVLSNDPIYLINLSQMALVANFMVDYVITSINMVFSTRILIGYYTILTPISLLMIMSWFFKFRQILMVLDMELNNQPQARERGDSTVRFYRILKGVIVLSISYFILRNILVYYWLWSLIMLYPLFQIYHNCRYVSRKSCFSWRIHLVAFLSQVSYLIGMKFFDDNIFKTPRDRVFCFVILGIVLGQIGFMKLQKTFGNLFFLPKNWRNEYNYMRNLSAVSTPDDLTCPICMLKLDENPEGEGLHKPLITKFMETPCKHTFHETCLKKWLDVRTICPCCRFDLPPCVD